MSYILDALKKSEQQRGHGAAPNVQTLHSSGLSYNSSRSQLWPSLAPCKYARNRVVLSTSTYCTLVYL